MLETADDGQYQTANLGGGHHGDSWPKELAIRDDRVSRFFLLFFLNFVHFSIYIEIFQCYSYMAGSKKR